MTIGEIARRLAAVALAAVDPERLVREALAGRGERWAAALALGKAAPAMARGAGGALAVRVAGARAALGAGEVVSGGGEARRLLVRTHGTPGLLDPAWEQLAGGHPLSDRQSLAAGERVLRWLGELPPGAPLIAMVSGGSSACVEALAGDLTLEELKTTQAALLASGLPIHAFNTVRKHLSAFKGGGALRASRGRVLALLLSDVIGDDPGTIGSGPFAADPTTFAEALAALSAINALDVPPRVRERLAAGARGELPETVKPGDPELERVESILVGSVATAVEAAAGEARRSGFTVVTGELAGEAAEAARALVARGRALGGARVALILGGETTVTLGPAPGRGGRNQELALAAARELAAGELVLSLATDGEDGPTRAAGGVVDGATWAAIERAGVDPAAALAGHDAQRALAAVPGALLETGNTGTNVGDLAIYLRG